MYFVDTNVFLRFILDDNDNHSPRSGRLFQLAKEGKITLWTNEWIIGEIIFVLESFYGKSKVEIAHVVKKILELQELSIEHRALLQSALQIYKEENIDFQDSMSACILREENLPGMYSFDKHTDRLSWIERKEP